MIGHDHKSWDMIKGVMEYFGHKQFYFIFIFLLFYFEGRWRDTWQGSHMTCHMVWHNKPRTWWKGLEDDVRAPGVYIVALSKIWGRNENEAWI